MKIEILTIFPDIFSSFLSESLLAKALAKGLLTVDLINIRDFTHDRHRTVDDRPYGGGPGMVIKPEPLSEAIDSRLALGGPKPFIINLTPSGRLLEQVLVGQLAQKERLMLICGRYEGVDQRVLDLYSDMDLSIGDYVLNGGEVPAMVLIEAMARLIPGFLSDSSSVQDDSHSYGLLEHPLYTRPRVFRSLSVPPVLLSGHHAQVAAYRLGEAMAKTRAVRPDLLEKKDVMERTIMFFSQSSSPLKGKDNK
ncbi:MAG: tRNA (guanosine(37)-N1)-methyltransferase TrmD [Deltaproteobacteria bacterium]|jgi:tRNA (guanine37-N1)-methyltransferase|nr:tRNA (guanosine(37)-N1)-methyltransferase TrmD [Deltaproteobacteria bacterium]